MDKVKEEEEEEEKSQTQTQTKMLFESVKVVGSAHVQFVLQYLQVSEHG